MTSKEELEKEMNGTWTIKEIIEAMKRICPQAWDNNDIKSST